MDFDHPKGGVLFGGNEALSADPGKAKQGVTTWTTAYHDGTIEVYERSPGGEPVLVDRYTDDKQAKIYRDALAANSRVDITDENGVRVRRVTPPVGEPRVTGTEPAPSASSRNGPPGGKPYIDDGPEAGPSGRRWGWDETAYNGQGGYTRDLGPSPSAQKEGVTGDRREPVEGRPGFIKVTKASKDQQGNEKTEIHFEDADGNVYQTLPPQSASGKQRVPVEGKPGIYKVTEAKKDGQGNETSDTYYENEQGERVPTPVDTKPDWVDPKTGTPYTRSTGPNGETILTEIRRQSAPQDPNKSQLKPLSMDQIVKGSQSIAQILQEALIDLYNDPSIDDAEKLKRAELLKGQAEAMIQERVSTLGAQQTSLNSRTSQRNVDMQDVNNRRSFAQDVWKNTQSAMLGVGKGMRNTPENAALLSGMGDAMLNSALQYATQAGGMAYVPREVPGPAIQQADQMDITGRIVSAPTPTFLQPMYQPVFTAQPVAATMSPAAVSSAPPTEPSAPIPNNPALRFIIGQ